MPNDITMIDNALRLFFLPGDVFEIRALDAVTPTFQRPHVESGYFDYEHIPEAAKAVSKLQCRGVYVTVNPVNPALLARSANRMQAAGRDAASKDSDILCRRWLLVDCDPVRPSGISATNEEHAHAFDKAMEIRDGLKTMGFPEPIVCDSGNGAQLMYRVDLPCDDGGLIQSCLKELAKANSDQVQIDQTVHNPARIWRLPGTMNCKGDSLPERPHRLASILEAPEELEVVSEELLKKLANNTVISLPQECSGVVDISAVAGPPPPPKEITFKIDEWIAKHCPDVLPFQPWNGGRKWIFPVCPFNPEHTNRSAAIFEQPSGALSFKCHHNGCASYGWADLRELKEPAKNALASATSSIEIAEIEEPEIESSKFWRDVKNKDIEAVLEGTMLGMMTDVFRQVTVPKLPLEAGLLKAVALAGCALSGKEENIDREKGLFRYVQTGAPLGRLCIDTAGGQISNVYAILIGPSSTGKDIGRLLGHITKKWGWHIGSRASAEGIADSLMKVNNGLIEISEFKDWMNPNHWQNRAIGFLTDAFDGGSFEYALSLRGKQMRRSIDYCFPNLIANIQPEIFESSVRKSDISSGFLARFLFCNMPVFFGDPNEIDLAELLGRLDYCVEAFVRKRGLVKVPNCYLSDLSKMFEKNSPSKLHPQWRRLVLGYGPRFATMLSVTSETAASENVVLTDREWGAARTMILWFFAQAERALINVEDMSPASKEYEEKLKLIFDIVKNADKGSGVLTSRISRNASKSGTSGKGRQDILKELQERELIKFENGLYSVIRTPLGW